MGLNKEKLKKKDFVENELEAVLAKTGYIETLEYVYEERAGEEVIITFTDGYVTSANVSGDSLIAIITDVMKEVREIV